MPFPIAVLISGGGTTLRNLIEKRAAGSLDIDIQLVISSNPSAGGLQFAIDAELPFNVIQKEKHPHAESFSDAIFNACREAEVQLVVMGGFIKHVTIPSDFENRVINIHPSLIPAFSGKGYYGGRVHQAVLDYGVKVSGCTVHFVNNEYDNGPVILQQTVPVADDDTPATLAARIFEEECAALPAAIRMIAAGVKVEGRKVVAT